MSKLEPHFKVRIGLKFGGMIFVASWTEPKIERNEVGEVIDIKALWINDWRYGDTVIHLQLDQVGVLSYRWSQGGK